MFANHRLDFYRVQAKCLASVVCWRIRLFCATPDQARCNIQVPHPTAASGSHLPLGEGLCCRSFVVLLRAWRELFKASPWSASEKQTVLWTVCRESRARHSQSGGASVTSVARDSETDEVLYKNYNLIYHLKILRASRFE